MPSVPEYDGMPGTDHKPWYADTLRDTRLVYRELRCVNDSEGSAVALSEAVERLLQGSVARVADRIRSAKVVLYIEWEGESKDIRRGVVFRRKISGCPRVFRYWLNRGDSLPYP